MILHHARIVRDRRLRGVRDFAFNVFEKFLGWFDDCGRGEDNPQGIIAKLWHSRENVRRGTIARLIDEYVRAGLVKRYRVGHGDYLEVVDFAEFVGVPAASRPRLMKCPPPSWAPRADHAAWAELGGIAGKVYVRREATQQLPLLDPPSTLASPSRSDHETGEQVARIQPAPSVPSVPSVPAGTDIPPRPPRLTPGGPRALAPPAQVTPEQLAEARAALAREYVVKLGGEVARKIERRWRHALLRGRSLEALLRAIAADQLEARRRAGQFDDWSMAWPPVVEDPPPEAPAPGSIYTPPTAEEREALDRRLREQLAQTSTGRGRGPPTDQGES